MTSDARSPVAALLRAVLLGAVLAGCVTTAAAAAPAGQNRSEATFTVGLRNDVDSLNPFAGLVPESAELRHVMYDTLTTTSSKDLTPLPSLATRWTISADGLTWTWTIRSGVTWSDGVALTAKDVAYTFDRIRRGSLEQTRYGDDVATLTEVTAPDETTVVMTTSTPTPDLARTDVPILPAHIWSKVSSEQAVSYRNEIGAVGSGPFVLTERAPGRSLRLRANQKYWGGAPAIDELVYRVYGTSAALVQALRQGEIDFTTGLDLTDRAALRAVPGIETRAGPDAGFGELTFNTGAALADGTPIGDGDPALADRKFRQALGHAVDRDALVEEVLTGGATAGPSPYRFDLARAGQLLDAAGYAADATGRRHSPDGEPLALRLYTRRESATSQRAGQLIEDWLETLGIPITLRVLGEDELAAQIGQGTFDLFEWGRQADPDPDHLLAGHTCAERSFQDGGKVFGGRSDSFYCTQKYDRLFAEQSRQLDARQRAATIAQLRELLQADVPYLVLYTWGEGQARSTRFTGFTDRPAPDSYLRVEPARPGTPPVASGTGNELRTIGIGAVLALGCAAAVRVASRRLRRPE